MFLSSRRPEALAAVHPSLEPLCASTRRHRPVRKRRRVAQRRQVSRQFVTMCKDANLVGAQLVRMRASYASSTRCRSLRSRGCAARCCVRRRTEGNHPARNATACRTRGVFALTRTQARHGRRRPPAHLHRWRRTRAETAIARLSRARAPPASCRRPRGRDPLQAAAPVRQALRRRQHGDQLLATHRRAPPRTCGSRLVEQRRRCRSGGGGEGRAEGGCRRADRGGRARLRGPPRAQAASGDRQPSYSRRTCPCTCPAGIGLARRRWQRGAWQRERGTRHRTAAVLVVRGPSTLKEVGARRAARKANRQQSLSAIIAARAAKHRSPDGTKADAATQP